MSAALFAGLVSGAAIVTYPSAKRVGFLLTCLAVAAIFVAVGFMLGASA